MVLASSEAPAVRAIVLVPYLRGSESVGEGVGLPKRTLAARVGETAGLARAIALDVIEAFAVPMSAMRPATLLGSGKVDEIAGQVRAGSIDLVVIDHPLSPVQQRNLERAWETKVIDRTGLILEIFGERAQTREGRLQVELAHLNYQKGRLVRSWTHLERQRGGFGFLGGPGETQIEADRRHIQERIARIEHDLEGVVRTRRLQRSNRRRVPHPIVALVGYTNAGKTTLFNALTQSTQQAEDLLFATLDPTLRRTTLPHGTEIIISDTVGFISDLPTHLVAAFRATLEEVVEADLVLHVRDASHPDAEAQAGDVKSVLSQLGIDPDETEHVIEVWNKIDAAPGFVAPPGRSRTIAISALTGEGIDRLLQVIEDALHAQRPVFRVHLEGDGLGQLHRLYEMGEVLAREEQGDGSTDIRIRLAEKALVAFRRAFPDATSEGHLLDVA